MLRDVFQWLDSHPSVYWAGAIAATAAMIAAIGRSLWARDGLREERRWAFPLAMAATLAAWRWPFLLEAREYNPDESQLIGGAITLTRDPVFWRSVDGTTSGPLNFYLLWPLHALGLPLDFFEARLTGLLLIALALTAVYRLMRTWMDVAPARLGVLPLCLYFATETVPGIIHYSSEHVSVALIAATAYWLWRPSAARPGSRAVRLAGGFAAGMLPWAKLQSGPVGFALVVGALWFVFRAENVSARERLRMAAEIVVATLLPTLIGLTAVLGSGQLTPFLQGYIRQNAAYVEGGATIMRAAAGMWWFLAESMAFPAFLAAILVIVAVSTAAIVVGRWRPSARTLVALGCVAIALGAVFVPRRPYIHYLLVAVVPLTLWAGATLADGWSARRPRRWFGSTLVALACVVPLYSRFVHPAPIGQLVESWRKPYSLPGTILRYCSRPGDELAVWGWRTDLYVDSGMPQATRDPHSVWSMMNTPAREYYRNRYLDDLRRNRPAFFVDAVGMGAAFYQERKEFGHETFPQLAAYIRQEYLLLADTESERIYVRSDIRRDATRDFRYAALSRILAKARSSSTVLAEAGVPAVSEPANLGYWDLEGRSVRMLLPPARLVWELDGSEREAEMEFGFHPRAYLEGHSNGADVFVEFVSTSGGLTQLFHRHLDPAVKTTDRGRQEAHFILPKTATGTRLIVRSDPGAYGDQAWDWVYLASLRWVRTPKLQFPGFEPAP